MRKKYNQRKLEILGILAYTINKNGNSAREIHPLLEPKPTFSSLSALLKHYKDMKLIQRKRINSIYHYTITAKGLKRLEWLVKQTKLLEREKLIL